MRHGRSLTLAAAFLSACACDGPQNQDDAAANAANAAQQQVVPELPVPALQQPLDREKLLIAAEHAASDFAGGIDDSARQKALADQKFEFRIRFGCQDAPAASAEKPFDWSVDSDSGALKVRATPTLSKADPSAKALAGSGFEAVEGFWIRRPWLLQATCPRQEASAAPKPSDSAKGSPGKPAATDKPSAPPIAATPAARLVGIAQFFTSADPRTLRRSGRPYEATSKLDEGDVPKGGFDLVMTGRLVALPDGRVIACTAAASGDRPSCIISVEFGTVSIERADTREQLAQWGSG